MSGLQRICSVCIGCGKCFGKQENIEVIKESFLFKKEKRKPECSFFIADLGTTTLAVECYDEEGNKVSSFSEVNSQRSFGADVLSRIQAAENKVVALQMQRLVKMQLQKALSLFQKQGQLVKKGFLAGNTTMMYLLMGHDPGELGSAPFRAEHLSREEFLLEGIPVMTLPGFSAFVGGDLMAGALAVSMDEEKENVLLVDLGTNGEMLLCSNGKIYGTATAAGPAFEGNATQGFACDRLKRVASIYEQGYMDENGILQEKFVEEGIVSGELRITQQMIQDLLVAKAAVRAGIEILLKKAGIVPGDLQKVYLAGGFGYFLEVRSAVMLGLFPKEIEDKIIAVGNSALAGAYLYGTSKDAEEKTQRIKEKTRIYNLAEEEAFTELFVSHMTLPEREELVVNLKNTVERDMINR